MLAPFTNAVERGDIKLSEPSMPAKNTSPTEFPSAVGANDSESLSKKVPTVVNTLPSPEAATPPTLLSSVILGDEDNVELAPVAFHKKTSDTIVICSSCKIARRAKRDV